MANKGSANIENLRQLKTVVESMQKQVIHMQLQLTHTQEQIMGAMELINELIDSENNKENGNDAKMPPPTPPLQQRNRARRVNRHPGQKNSFQSQTDRKMQVANQQASNGNRAPPSQTQPLLNVGNNKVSSSTAIDGRDPPPFTNDISEIPKVVNSNPVFMETVCEKEDTLSNKDRSRDKAFTKFKAAILNSDVDLCSTKVEDETFTSKNASDSNSSDNSSLNFFEDTDFGEATLRNEYSNTELNTMDSKKYLKFTYEQEEKIFEIIKTNAEKVDWSYARLAHIIFKEMPCPQLTTYTRRALEGRIKRYVNSNRCNFLDMKLKYLEEKRRHFPKLTTDPRSNSEIDPLI